MPEVVKHHFFSLEWWSLGVLLFVYCGIVITKVNHAHQNMDVIQV